MSEPSSFGERLEQLVDEYVEVLLGNEKIISGKLLTVEKQSMNVAIASGEGVFFIRGDSVVAIKKGGLALE